jgi:antitoxin component YwqK of YwqJK toxin-antitoxin module
MESIEANQSSVNTEETSGSKTIFIILGILFLIIVVVVLIFLFFSQDTKISEIEKNVASITSDRAYEVLEEIDGKTYIEGRVFTGILNLTDKKIEIYYEEGIAKRSIDYHSDGKTKSIERTFLDDEGQEYLETTYYKSGAKGTEKYVSNSAEGKTDYKTSWDENGYLVSKEDFLNNMLIEYDSEGKPRQGRKVYFFNDENYRRDRIGGNHNDKPPDIGKIELNYLDGILHGEKKYWRLNGKMARECLYNEGKVVDKCKVYDVHGRLEKEIIYKNGIYEETKEYDPNEALSEMSCEELIKTAEMMILDSNFCKFHDHECRYTYQSEYPFGCSQIAGTRGITSFLGVKKAYAIYEEKGCPIIEYNTCSSEKELKCHDNACVIN